MLGTVEGTVEVIGRDVGDQIADERRSSRSSRLPGRPSSRRANAVTAPVAAPQQPVIGALRGRRWSNGRARRVGAERASATHACPRSPLRSVTIASPKAIVTTGPSPTMPLATSGSPARTGVRLTERSLVSRSAHRERRRTGARCRCERTVARPVIVATGTPRASKTPRAWACSVSRYPGAG